MNAVDEHRGVDVIADTLGRSYIVHGLNVRVVGDVLLGLDPVPDSDPDVTVYASARPGWHDEPLDPARLLHTSDPADPDATVRDAGWVTNRRGVRIRYAEGATFWISAGFDEISFVYDAPLNDADGVHFLLEPVLAFVLRRRGTLVLHASAVELAGRAVVFCGPSGAGKSTVAAVCISGGATLLSDDVVAVAERGPARTADWVAHRGTASLRLWDDVAGVLLSDLESAPRFSATWSKRVVDPVRLGAIIAPAEVPLALVCIMGPPLDTPGHDVERLSGIAAVRALLPNTAASFLHDAESRAAELDQLTSLVDSIPVARIRMNRDFAFGRNAVRDVVASALGEPRGA